jgi:hypothetical protein
MEVGRTERVGGGREERIRGGVGRDGCRAHARRIAHAVSMPEESRSREGIAAIKCAVEVT